MQVLLFVDKLMWWHFWQIHLLVIKLSLKSYCMEGGEGETENTLGTLLSFIFDSSKVFWPFFELHFAQAVTCFKEKLHDYLLTRKSIKEVNNRGLKPCHWKHSPLEWIHFLPFLLWIFCNSGKSNFRLYLHFLTHLTALTLFLISVFSHHYEHTWKKC